jgi:hypothetical protein
MNTPNTTDIWKYTEDGEDGKFYVTFFLGGGGVRTVI